MKALSFFTKQRLILLLLFSTFGLFESCQKDLVETPDKNLTNNETYGQTADYWL